jgi:hypothetical protein
VDATVLAVIRMALNALADRVLTLISLMMTFGLSCWAMHLPTQERLLIAAGFAILVFVPSVIKEKRREGLGQHEPQ